MSKAIEKPYTILGFLVRQGRMDRNMTTTALAKKVGLSDSSMRALEIGQQRVPFHVVVKLSKLLDLDLNSIKNS